jgi:membrane-associated phospholipid phosphatase
MPFDIVALHEKIFFFFYHALGPASLVSPLTIFCAVWLPWLLAILPFVYELYKHEEFSILKLFRKIYLIPFLAYLATMVIKFFYLTPRPFALFEIPPAFVVSSDPYGLASFPSSHTAVFAGLAVVVFLANRKIGKWFFVGALVIGIARIGAGVHFPIDILGGFLLGASVGFFFEKIFSLIQRRSVS